jgi:sugar lactone lactonase YvrE
LRELEQKFGEDLFVIGVHSGKFIAERDTDNIRAAAERLNVRHAIVNDRQFRVWRSYVVNAWPTLTLVDPEGYVVGQQAGEVTADMLAPAIERIISAAQEKGTLDRARVASEVVYADRSPLSFPEKVVAGDDARRLFIADTRRHRVVGVRLDEDGLGGDIDIVIGEGAPGFDDGDFATATLRNPHGLAVRGQMLYIADTENHSIRVADLRARHIATLAGTGEQARRFFMTGGRGLDVALNSPWDVLVHEDMLYIAMAGFHQIWRMDTRTFETEPWAGSGAEDIFDGPLARAALAQPSGLASDGTTLYIADSESSAVRRVEMRDDAEVLSIAGTGLFDFGDKDGIGEDARLQHPLGVAWHDGTLFVADTYNGKIKRLDPATREVRSWLGGNGELWEPGGLCVLGDRVYIADTNHHRVMTARVDDSTLQLLVIRE